ncbi:MAG: 16S rRNA (uracil(1498)-N(3))-methyltransferase [Breznakibacter sp.]
MELFYTANFEENNYTLSEEESNHCINVLRHRTSHSIAVTDGKGNLYEGIIVDAHHKRCRISVERTSPHTSLLPYLHIAIAPTKNIERLEWFIEKSTEIGISEITLLLCQHSERKQVRLDRLEKILVSAMKQSGSLFLPVLNDLISLNNFVSYPHQAQKCIAHCNEGKRYPLFEKARSQAPIIVMIGPEGDFSPNEIELALKNGFDAVTLGNSRLRTETAGMVACHTVHLMNEIQHV